MRAAHDPAAMDPAATDPAGPVDDLDADDAFGHPVIADAARDDAVWSDGDEDDIDV
ncbi:hypothetical protein EDF64_10511 [Curtobacterium flaccumfaciens]|uniref:Uncharacterized protein n=1 Tax=Curtobacterium flaccumfaciens TaxID=2035 RepID=A0A4V3BKU2_9MICO|nr:hypothetical protein EDF64_10511 [Curtobacterium flaccumfaciens]